MKKKGHRRGGSGFMSMGSVGDLIKGTMKKKFGSMDITDAEVSLSRQVIITWSIMMFLYCLDKFTVLRLPYCDIITAL